MYQFLLSFHSLFRWLVLIFLLIAIFRAYRGRIRKLSFTSFDSKVMNATVKVVQLQFTIGILLYCISPIVRYFLFNFKEAVHIRDIRFFGMEHITVMILAVGIISIGSEEVKKATGDYTRFKIMSTWFTIGLILILSSIPWSFSPLISRPNLRLF